MRRQFSLLAIATLAAPLPGLAQTVTAAPDVAPASGLVIRASPRIDPSLWFADGDYPLAAMRAEQEGHAGVLLDIASDGRVDACTQLSSEYEWLGRASCRILIRRARFTPALGRDRKPAPDRWNVSIDWKLPPFPPRREDPTVHHGVYGDVPVIATEHLSAPEALGDPDLWLQPADYPPELLKRGGKIEVTLKVAKNGLVRSCRIDVSSSVRRWDRQVCALLRRRARFQPEKQAEEKWRSNEWWHRYSWGPATAQ
ncbi:TonB family protein [Sphingomonas kyeonggiensis]|uniref:TonB family protein n=1 Tax=Sphingomonas kyeonggiensis TaxID=1268553 RepID=A0A7W7NSE8_9SPHN|nr:TonB family protein [Sphingomonas kyeonggiensis]MBB4838817.1 TonB family protein [Sphingomonas kyeonggiensis]